MVRVVLETKVRSEERNEERKENRVGSLALGRYLVRSFPNGERNNQAHASKTTECPVKCQILIINSLELMH